MIGVLGYQNNPASFTVFRMVRFANFHSFFLLIAFSFLEYLLLSEGNHIFTSSNSPVRLTPQTLCIYLSVPENDGFDDLICIG